MGMKINAELPLPANLKAEYPLPKELAEIKKKRDAEIQEILKENPINLLLSWDHVPQTMKILCATM